MITIYRYGIDPYPDPLDPEEYFGFVELTGDEIERAMLKEIERAEYNDNLSFIDHYGYKLPRGFLSTGSKAALTVYHNQDKVVDCVGCGTNAISSILRHCPCARIVLPAIRGGFETGGASSERIRFGDYIFDNLMSFSWYMSKVFPGMPEEGFVHVQSEI